MHGWESVYRLGHVFFIRWRLKCNFSKIQYQSTKFELIELKQTEIVWCSRHLCCLIFILITNFHLLYFTRSDLQKSVKVINTKVEKLIDDDKEPNFWTKTFSSFSSIWKISIQQNVLVWTDFIFIENCYSIFFYSQSKYFIQIHVLYLLKIQFDVVNSLGGFK